MKVADYDEFVRRTDQYSHRSRDDRRVIALYGLVGEIGSLCSAIKKKLLAEGGEEQWDRPNDEVIEELGDVIWYCFSLAQIENGSRQVNILTNDIALLKREISGKNARARKIHAALDPTTKNTFLKAATHFPATKDMNFEDYQRLAFLTARTTGRDLIEVCLAVLWQLGAELLRNTLPDIELTINKKVADRSVNVVLGEIAWHLSAVASLLHLSMNLVVDKNVHKVSFRASRDAPTPFHDADREEFEQLPRQFEIAFVSVQKNRSRMYYRGRQLGDDLTDNAYEDDGYRFHDILHLANVAHLGWSPVLRKLMARKRKSRSDQVDEVEDGARALIVEELVLKAIHSEGVRLAKEAGVGSPSGPARTFSARGLITFRFLKSLRGFVDGLEVWKNQYWEWENAIFDGSEIYHKLRLEQQGTIIVDMDRRTIEYSPDVCVDMRGGTVGLGIGKAPAGIGASEVDAVLTANEKSSIPTGSGPATAVAVKRAILDALRVSGSELHDLEVKLLPDRRVCTKARGTIQRRMWDIGAIGFQIAVTETSSAVECTAMAIADIKDLT
jgi:NTP pyrophosphatase (non-canonical NTP hydrolase)